MAEMQVTLSFVMAEELDDGTHEEYYRQGGLHRTYVFMSPEKIKELTEDKGLLGDLIRNMHRDYLNNGG